MHHYARSKRRLRGCTNLLLNNSLVARVFPKKCRQLLRRRRYNIFRDHDKERNCAKKFVFLFLLLLQKKKNDIGHLLEGKRNGRRPFVPAEKAQKPTRETLLRPKRTALAGRVSKPTRSQRTRETLLHHTRIALAGCVAFSSVSRSCVILTPIVKRSLERETKAVVHRRHFLRL